ncbi:hypothetical protein ONZ45_g12296 [Pleurotus djamor]|nr:hypothetical protein ONZ45_g12296 [Pleurotus djamor]
MNDYDSLDPSSSRLSERFDAADSDITLRSCDGVLFKVHRINLKMHSDIFADAEDISSSSSLGPSTRDSPPSSAPSPSESSSTSTETIRSPPSPPSVSKLHSEQVQLSESSEVLNVLLQYMYRQPPPDLYELEFEVLEQVAEAADKYRVFFAIDACKRAMRDAIPSYSFQVLNWAVKHKHTQLIDEAAEYTIHMSSDNMKDALALSIQGAWITYHKYFLDTLNAQYTRYLPTASHWNSATRDVDLPCEAWTHAYALVAHALGARPWMMLPERKWGNTGAWAGDGEGVSVFGAGGGGGGVGGGGASDSSVNGGPSTGVDTFMDGNIRDAGDVEEGDGERGRKNTEI